MNEVIHIDGVTIVVSKKDIKHIHLSVHPPLGRVTLKTPRNTRIEVARAYAITKLSWIRKQQSKFIAQARTSSPQYIERESHYIWGRRYLLRLNCVCHAKPSVVLSNKQIILTIRPDTGIETRQQVVNEWHKVLMHQTIPKLIEKWEKKLGVKVSRYFLQRMKTKWGSCNHKAKNIRINTELVKKPKDLLEYVIVHEMIHLIEPSHNERFFSILSTHYPSWREARLELNELPLAAENWAD